jgi:hypothetical protein
MMDLDGFISSCDKITRQTGAKPNRARFGIEGVVLVLKNAADILMYDIPLPLRSRLCPVRTF